MTKVEEKIGQLYSRLGIVTAGYLMYQERNNVSTIREMIPQIQEFVLWFMEENRFGISEALYQDLNRNLVEILSDILEAIRYQDRVLMHDAVAYGLMEYLEMLLGIEQKEDANGDI